MGDQRWGLWVPWSPGTASAQLRTLVPGLTEQAVRQSPGDALTLAFIGLLCLVINDSIAGQLLLSCVSRCLEPESPQGGNCVSLVHDQDSWQGAWYTVGA